MKLFLKSITFLGSVYFFIFIVLLTFLLNQTYSLKLFLALLLTWLITFLIRFFYFKRRPNRKTYKNLFQKLYNSSFPSVHAARAVVLAYFFSKIYFNIVFVLGFWLIALLVCYTRIYLKHHYLIDVICGAFFGFLVSVFIL